MSIRKKFEKTFGKDNAEKLWQAAIKHENRINSKSKGSDPFKWAILICIGYQCIEIEGYHDSHGFSSKLKFSEFKKWVKKNAKLESHDGDCDYLSLACGTYGKYINGGKDEKEKTREKEIKSYSESKTETA